MLLSSSGESTARELDVTARYTRGENELNASFVRARSTGDLSGLGTLYQNFRSPLLLANERSLFELDVPARAAVLGHLAPPRGHHHLPGTRVEEGVSLYVPHAGLRGAGDPQRPAVPQLPLFRPASHQGADGQRTPDPRRVPDLQLRGPLQPAGRHRELGQSSVRPVPQQPGHGLRSSLLARSLSPGQWVRSGERKRGTRTHSTANTKEWATCPCFRRRTTPLSMLGSGPLKRTHYRARPPLLSRPPMR